MHMGFIGAAYELYRRFTPSDNAKARELFEKAIALDPNYASAYADVGVDTFHRLGALAPGKPKESYQKALDLA